MATSQALALTLFVASLIVFGLSLRMLRRAGRICEEASQMAAREIGLPLLDRRESTVPVAEDRRVNAT